MEEATVAALVLLLVARFVCDLGAAATLCAPFPTAAIAGIT